jgi:WD40 repeat protein
MAICWLTGGRDSRIILWNLATGLAELSLLGHSDVVNAVAFSPDGRMLASSALDGEVRLWDASSGETATLQDTAGPIVRGIVFSPDGGTLASFGDDTRVTLWNLNTGLPGRVLSGDALQSMPLRSMGTAPFSQPAVRMRR